MICSAEWRMRFIVKSPAQSGRMRTLIHRGPISYGHVRINPDNQHRIQLLKIGDGTARRQKLRIGEDRETARAAIGVGSEDRLRRLGGAPLQDALLHHARVPSGGLRKVCAQASTQRRLLAWPAQRPLLLVGVFPEMNTMSAAAVYCSTVVEK